MVSPQYVSSYNFEGLILLRNYFYNGYIDIVSPIVYP